MATPITARRIFVFEEVYGTPLPSLCQLLSQGAISGALGGFVIALAQAISIPSVWNALLVVALPIYMGWLAIHGLTAGFVVWAFTRAFHHRFGGPARIVMVASFFCGLYLVLSFLLPESASPPQAYVRAFGIVTTVIVVSIVGLVTGSTWRPGRAFSHGLWHVKSRQQLLETIAASFLRIIVFFGLLDSILLLVCVLEGNLEYPDQNRDLWFGILGFLYFLAATVIVFANPKLWLTSTLVLLLHSPFFFILVKFPNEIGYLWHFIIAYLSLWGAFLITQSRVLYSAFSVIKEELRYYLID